MDGVGRNECWIECFNDDTGVEDWSIVAVASLPVGITLDKEHDFFGRFRRLETLVTFMRVPLSSIRWNTLSNEE